VAAGTCAQPIASAVAGQAGGIPGPITIIEHHYTMTARVRPLLLFWISRSGVGDATVTWRRAPGQTGHSLLIGSDPDRAPRRINRWGYIDEEVRGTDARLIGLMTESQEESIQDAEAGLRKQANGQHTFKIIRATVDGEQAQSVITTVATPDDYSFRYVRTVLALAEREASAGKTRVVRLPAGTRPGFLSALVELMRAGVASLDTTGAVRPAPPIPYVYHGRIYQLRASRVQLVPELRIGATGYRRVINADFEIKSTYDGEIDRFSMTYGTDGSLAEGPSTVAYQPRWWMQVELALDDCNGAPAMAGGAGH